MASLEGLAEELLYEERKDVAELSFEQLCLVSGELFGPENITGGLKELPMTETIKGATALETLRGLLSGQVAQLNALMFGDEAADKLISRIVDLRISYIPRMTNALDEAGATFTHLKDACVSKRSIQPPDSEDVRKYDELQQDINERLQQVHENRIR